MIDNYNGEQYDLKVKIKNGEHNDEMSSDEIEPVLFDEPQLNRRSYKLGKYVFSIASKKTNLYSIGLLLFIIGISVVALASYHSSHQRNDSTIKNQDYSNNRNHYRYGSEEKIGYFNLYIRVPTSSDNRPYVDKLQFPAVQYSSNQMPLSGRVINFELPTKILVHVSTQQTIVYSSKKAFILPPLFNYYEDIFSIGALIASGYACFENDDKNCLHDFIDVASLFYPRKVFDPDMPKLNSKEGGFIGGVDTNYRSSFPSKLRKRPSFEVINSKQSDTYGYETSYRTANPYYKRPPVNNSDATADNVKEIDWKQCNDPLLQAMRAECGFVSVPLDYNNPKGEQIKIAVSRLKHSVTADKYQGAILINPGGPGGSGLQYSMLAMYFDPTVSSTYDWIGFDPRGVGDSIPPVSCDPTFTMDPRPSFDPINQTLEDYWYNRGKKYSLACAKKYPKLLQHMTTVDVAKDMNKIRIALKQKRISYFGMSYGSYLGQVFATLFPNHIRRMIIDGNIDPKTTWFPLLTGRNREFDRNKKMWFNWLAQHDDVFNLGKTECVVAQKYLNARKELKTGPINGIIGPSDWDDIFLGVVYTREIWIPYGTMFSAWVNNKNFDLLLAEYQRLSSGDNKNSIAIYFAVICSDVPWPNDWNYVRTETWRSYAVAPYSAWQNGWSAAQCLEWPVTGTKQFVVDGRNIGDILVVGATLDAITLIEGSYAVRRLFRNARLLTIVNETSHLNNFLNACVNSIITQYLKTGELPVRKTGDVADYECSAAPNPDPTITILPFTTEESNKRWIKRSYRFL